MRAPLDCFMGLVIREAPTAPSVIVTNAGALEDPGRGAMPRLRLPSQS